MIGRVIAAISGPDGSGFRSIVAACGSGWDPGSLPDGVVLLTSFRRHSPS